MHVVADLLLVASLSQAAAAASAATGGITGRVTADGTNAPIVGARVLLFPAGRPAGHMGPPPQVTTDQDGRYAFTRLTPGEYRLDVQKTGFVPLNQPPARPRTFTVAPGQALAVDLRLQRGGVISGRVIDTRGDPMTDVRVMALRRMPAPARAAAAMAAPRLMPAPMQGPQQTNDLGEFRVSGLAPGEYVIAAVPHRFSSFGGPGVAPRAPARSATAVTTFYPGTADQAGAQMITVASGAEVANIVFMIQSSPAFRVSGIVVDESGAPIGDAMVRLMTDPRSGGVGFGLGPMGNGQSDATGRFVIDDVPAGSYRASASVMIRMGSSGSGAVGAVSGGYVGSSTVTRAGGVLSGQFFSFSSGPVGGIEQAAEVVVTDSDVSDVRIVARRPPAQQ
jgi:hypothetical protein